MLRAFILSWMGHGVTCGLPSSQLVGINTLGLVEHRKRKKRKKKASNASMVRVQTREDVDASQREEADVNRVVNKTFFFPSTSYSPNHKRILFNPW